jgi:hypothetical protein
MSVENASNYLTIPINNTKYVEKNVFPRIYILNKSLCGLPLGMAQYHGLAYEGQYIEPQKYIYSRKSIYIYSQWGQITTEHHCWRHKTGLFSALYSIKKLEKCLSCV